MSRRSSFMGDFRQFFGRGLAILLPSMLTLWILWQVFVFVFNNVAEPINMGIRMTFVRIVPAVIDEERYKDNKWVSWALVTSEDVEAYRNSSAGQSIEPGASDTKVRQLVQRERVRRLWNDYPVLSLSGFAVAIMLIYLAGILLGGFFGRQIYARIEAFLKQLPGFKQVYPHVKQVVDLIIGEKALAFNRVVLVQYPRKGIWTLGLVTGRSFKKMQEATPKDCISIFIPSTPTPFTGFTINLPADETIDVPISIEEAIRFFITGGVLVPDSQHIGDLELHRPGENKDKPSKLEDPKEEERDENDKQT